MYIDRSDNILLHRLVWFNDVQVLREVLESAKHSAEPSRQQTSLGKSQSSVTPKATLQVNHPQSNQGNISNKNGSNSQHNHSTNQHRSNRSNDSLAASSLEALKLHAAAEKPFVDLLFRGKTPLHLAVQLNHHEAIKVLLEYGADTLVLSDLGFFPLQDATAMGNRDVMRALLLSRHDQLCKLVIDRQPTLHHALTTDLPDFYMEMQWQFHSWVPFLSMLCPSDKYRVWKHGSKVRVDTTLVGFEKLRWVRGNVSFLFSVDEDKSTFYMADHEKKIYEEVDKLQAYTEQQIEEDLNMRLNTEIVSGRVQRKQGSSKRIMFVRSRSGLFGMGSEKEQNIAGFKASVYHVENLEWVSKTRREHLRDCPNNNKAKAAAPRAHTNGHDQQGKPATPNAPLADIDKVIESAEVPADASPAEIESMLQDAKTLMYKFVPSLAPPKESEISFEDYFPEAGCAVSASNFRSGLASFPSAASSASFHSSSSSLGRDPNALPYVHIGRPLEYKEKSRAIKASMWMADSYPLSIQQLIPFLEIMSPTNEHFEKLREFIQMDLPPGFPIQVEVPILSFLSAQVTFHNYTPWYTSANGNGGADALKPATPASSTSRSKSIPDHLPRPTAHSIGENYSTDEWFKVPQGYQPGIVIKNIFKRYDE